jgi:hypothetical protein
VAKWVADQGFDDTSYAIRFGPSPT